MLRFKATSMPNLKQPKELPESILGAPTPISEAARETVVEQQDETLVNKIPPQDSPPFDRKGTVDEVYQDKINRLQAALDNANEQKGEWKAKYMTAKDRNDNYSEASRKFRIFLSLLQGAAARGTFDSENLRKTPGSEPLLLRHFVNLTNVAHTEIGQKF